MDDSENRLEELKLSLSNDSSATHETALLNGKKSPNGVPVKEDAFANKTGVENANPVVQKSPSTSAAHSRQSSQTSTISTELRSPKPSVGLGDCHKGLIVGLHRKMVISLT